MTNEAVIQRAIQKMERSVISEASKALLRTGEKTVAHAKKLSSGGLSIAEQRRRGHPYAARFPGLATDFIINAQSGRFREDWQVIYGYNRLRIVNNNPVADFLVQGTLRMRVRPINEAVKDFAQATLDKELKAATERIERKS